MVDTYSSKLEPHSYTFKTIYEESPQGAASGFRSCHFFTFFVTSDISPDLISCTYELKFGYVGGNPWGTKLPLAIYGTEPNLWHFGHKSCQYG